MTTEVIVAFAGLGVTVLAHMSSSIWWASKMNTTMEHIGKTLIRIDKELEKRDAQAQKMWERIDALRDMITTKP